MSAIKICLIIGFVLFVLLEWWIWGYSYGKAVGIREGRQLIDEPHECYFKWSLADNGWADHTCSKCGFVENTDIHVGLDWNYCPNCGRKVVSK